MLIFISTGKSISYLLENKENSDYSQIINKLSIIIKKALSNLLWLHLRVLSILILILVQHAKRLGFVIYFPHHSSDLLQGRHETIPSMFMRREFFKLVMFCNTLALFNMKESQIRVH